MVLAVAQDGTPTGAAWGILLHLPATPSASAPRACWFLRTARGGAKSLLSGPLSIVLCVHPPVGALFTWVLAAESHRPHTPSPPPGIQGARATDPREHPLAVLGGVTQRDTIARPCLDRDTIARTAPRRFLRPQ